MGLLAGLSGLSAQTLDALVKDWKDKSAVFYIVGHADLAGSKKYNASLFQKRANAVKKALQKRSVPRAQIVAVGMGNTAPAVVTRPGQRLRANRRVGLTAIAPKKPPRRTRRGGSDRAGNPSRTSTYFALSSFR